MCLPHSYTTYSYFQDTEQKRSGNYFFLEDWGVPNAPLIRTCLSQSARAEQSEQAQETHYTEDMNTSHAYERSKA